MSFSEQTNWFRISSSLKFVIQILCVYAAWKMFHQFFLKTFLLQQWQLIVSTVGSWYAQVATEVLTVFGEETYRQSIAVIYKKSHNIILVEEHCLAFPAMVLFTGSILFFKGDWKAKLWFIPMGLIAIVVINLLRLILLCITFEHFSRQYFEINHSYIYVALTYGLIMLLIIWWMDKFISGAKV